MVWCSSDQVPVYMRVTSCYIALYYYMGFALMMMRRYSDAVRNMTGVLMYLYRTQVIAERRGEAKRGVGYRVLCRGSWVCGACAALEPRARGWRALGSEDRGWRAPGSWIGILLYLSWLLFDGIMSCSDGCVCSWRCST